jgi:SAM-dependent methyltransferase
MTFDPLASSYDTDFTHKPIARWLRGRIHARLNTLWHPPDHVLELGCGTGEDARHLAAQGIRVTATDASPAMLEHAREKNQHTPLAEFHLLDLNYLPDNDFIGPYDGAFSNFGVLNCLEDWHPLAEWLAARIRPGGVVALSIMSRYCLWEIGWNLLHLKPGQAARRLHGQSSFQPDDAAEAITIHYPTARQMAKAFAPWFVRTGVQGIGLTLPNTESYDAIEKRPRLMHALMRLDNRLSSVETLARFADHYWIEFRRRKTKNHRVNL